MPPWTWYTLSVGDKWKSRSLSFWVTGVNSVLVCRLFKENASCSLHTGSSPSVSTLVLNKERHDKAQNLGWWEQSSHIPSHFLSWSLAHSVAAFSYPLHSSIWLVFQKEQLKGSSSSLKELIGDNWGKKIILLVRITKTREARISVICRKKESVMLLALDLNWSS